MQVSSNSGLGRLKFLASVVAVRFAIEIKSYFGDHGDDVDENDAQKFAGN